MSIFDRKEMRELYDTHREEGMTHKKGLAECFSWHGVTICFMSDYPTDRVFVEINGKPACKYFDVGGPLCNAEDIFWNTPEYVQKVENMFLGNTAT